VKHRKVYSDSALLAIDWYGARRKSSSVQEFKGSKVQRQNWQR